MGYYTKYKLEVFPHPDKEKELDITDFLSLKIFGEGAKIRDHWNDYLVEEMKWYDYKHDMLELSKKFPGFVFKLCGEGEESNDLWECYFKNGKSQFCKAKIIYEKFDESKLK